MKHHIFREYDIRGIVPDDLNEDSVKLLGAGIGVFYRSKGAQRISLGHDCRLSSPDLSRWFSDALAESGIDVVEVGMVPTPVLYFSIHHLGADGGVQITGSHNPPDFNGLKICLGDMSVYGDEIQGIRKIIESEKFNEDRAVKRVGKKAKADVIGPYTKYLVENIKPGPFRKKVVVDAGNGAGGPVAPEIYKSLGFDIIPLFCEPDGRFPNHHPDPTIPENLETLRSKVLSNSADLGIAFDGDADRIGVVDRRGEIIWSDRLMVLFSRDLLTRHPGATIIGEVKCSQVLYDDIREKGGRAIMWKAGHSLIKGKMKEEKALFAGEMSGHLFFGERYFGFDDAIYAGARLLEILSNTEKDLSDLLSDVPDKVNTPEIRLDCPDDIKFQVVAELVEEFKKEYKVIDVDGARVLMDEGWGLIRASNTQPALVLRFEAEDEEGLEKIRALFMDKLEEKMSLA
ncbi:phosphomannomutase/phosphoglucomutase [Thermodesulfobacteriota bacterium]